MEQWGEMDAIVKAGVSNYNFVQFFFVLFCFVFLCFKASLHHSATSSTTRGPLEQRLFFLGWDRNTLMVHDPSLTSFITAPVLLHKLPCRSITLFFLLPVHGCSAEQHRHSGAPDAVHRQQLSMLLTPYPSVTMFT